MKKQMIIIFAGIILSWGFLGGQTAKKPGVMDYKLGFSTYLSHTDKYAANFDVCTDNNGNTYVSGNTRDKNFPVTKDAYQKEIKGEADAFVAKYALDGKLVFATLIGGTKREHHTAITVDKDGYIYLAGGTHSADFPVTKGSYDSSFNGEGEWAGDVYVTKINPDGSEIVFSTFLGGKVEETPCAGTIKLDAKGNIIVAGTTCSEDFPTTKGVIYRKFTKQDSFLSKLSPNGDKLLFSTSIGNGVMDMITGVAVDNKDNIYVTGYTVANDLPVTNNAIRKTRIMPKRGGFQEGIDHFVAKVDKTGTKILYLSYIGGGGHMGSNIAWTGPNRLMVCSSTKEEGFPVTAHAIGKKSKGERDCFISVFNSDDMILQFSTLFGGSESDHVMSSSFLSQDTVIIGGKTCSPDFPLTENALYKEFPTWEKTFNNTFFGRRKSFVSVIDIKNGKLLYSTYLGACFRFKTHADKSGNVSFIAEAGQREAAGMTGFPITENRMEEPPTYIMLGRLALNNHSKKEQ